MATKRQIEQTVTYCMSIMARYHDVTRTARTSSGVVGEIQTIAAWVDDLGLEANEADEQILRPVESWLLDRYGPELGARLNTEFVDSFQSLVTGHGTGTADPIHQVR